MPSGVSRRSFVKTGVGVAAALGFGAAFNPWARAAGSEPVGYALTTGLDEVDQTHFDNHVPALDGPVNDARTMAKIALDKGFFDVITLTNDLADNEGRGKDPERATIFAVLRHIKHAADILKPGDLFLLTFSTHGTSGIPDENGDESDRLDEALVLHDGFLIDDILYKSLSRFQPGVRVLVFSDTCASGSITKALQFQELAKQNKILKPDGTPANDAIDSVKKHTPAFIKNFSEGAKHSKKKGPANARVTSPFKGLDPAAAKAVYNQNRDFYKELERVFGAPKGKGAKAFQESMGASGLLFGACQDSQEALAAGSSDGNSLFTQNLDKALKRNPSSYRTLFAALKDRSPVDSVPNIFTFGNLGRLDDAFYDQLPFFI